MSTDLDRLAERMQAIDEVSKLKARYCRYVDTKQWGKFRALFTDDPTPSPRD